MASQRCAFEYGPSVTLTVAAFRVSFSPRADDRVSLTECGELLSLESCRLQGIPRASWMVPREEAVPPS